MIDVSLLKLCIYLPFSFAFVYLILFLIFLLKPAPSVLCVSNLFIIEQCSRAPWIEKAQATYEWFRSSFPEVDLDAILKTVDELNTQYAASTADEVL